VFIRQQARRLRVGPHFAEECLRDVAFQEPVSILAEDGRHPDRVIHTQADEPPEQQVVLQLLHQQPLAAHGVQRLQQQRAQQLLGRDRRPTDVGIQAVKTGRQSPEHRVGHLANRTQRMVGRDPIFRRHVTKQMPGLLVVSTHRLAPSVNGSIVVRRDHDVDPVGVTFSASC
jgi:hypothetical protein